MKSLDEICFQMNISERSITPNGGRELDMDRLPSYVSSRSFWRCKSIFDKDELDFWRFRFWRSIFFVENNNCWNFWRFTNLCCTTHTHTHTASLVEQARTPTEGVWAHEEEWVGLRGCTRPALVFQLWARIDLKLDLHFRTGILTLFLKKYFVFQNFYKIELVKHIIVTCDTNLHDSWSFKEQTSVFGQKFQFIF